MTAQLQFDILMIDESVIGTSNISVVCSSSRWNKVESEAVRLFPPLYNQWVYD